jgi:hypothetical protein
MDDDYLSFTFRIHSRASITTFRLFRQLQLELVTVEKSWLNREPFNLNSAPILFRGYRAQSHANNIHQADSANLTIRQTSAPSTSLFRSIPQELKSEKLMVWWILLVSFRIILIFMTLDSDWASRRPTRSSSAAKVMLEASQPGISNEIEVEHINEINRKWWAHNLRLAAFTLWALLYSTSITKLVEWIAWRFKPSYMSLMIHVCDQYIVNLPQETAQANASPALYITITSPVSQLRANTLTQYQTGMFWIRTNAPPHVKWRWLRWMHPRRSIHLSSEQGRSLHSFLRATACHLQSPPPHLASFLDNRWLERLPIKTTWFSEVSFHHNTSVTNTQPWPTSGNQIVCYIASSTNMFTLVPACRKSRLISTFPLRRSLRLRFLSCSAPLAKSEWLSPLYVSISRDPFIDDDRTGLRTH